MTEQRVFQQQTILVVDDNEANRSLARFTLEDEGYSVFLATNGREAIRIFEAQAPDCVLLDVRMPEIDGLAACEAIRLLPKGKETPVIFLTALRDVDTFDRALKAGGDDFVTKPVSPAELVIRVQTVLKLRSMRNELHDHYELLKRQRDDLMRLQLQKERLTAFLVHDLKNPVNSMDLYAQLLLREKGLSSEALQAVSQIRLQARQLNRLILNLLDLSKADEGKLQPKRENFDVSSVVSDIANEFEIYAQSRQVTLQSIVTKDVICADRELFRRLLANLVENAIRHAPTKSIVFVKLDVEQDSVQLEVRDSGVGVPESLRERIFDPFIQLDSPHMPSSRNGRGLGLAFCKLVALSHDGKIWVEDAQPGARFRVRFPQ